MPPHRSVLLNTPPLRYLHAAGCLALLEEMYGTVLVPPAAVRELGRGAQPLEVLQLPFVQLAIPEPGVDGGRESPTLGPATLEVFALARRLESPLLILEERAHRQAARNLGLEATGVLGVLLKARQDGRIASVKDLLGPLGEAGFPLPPKLAGGVLLLAGEL